MRRETEGRIKGSQRIGINSSLQALHISSLDTKNLQRISGWILVRDLEGDSEGIYFVSMYVCTFIQNKYSAPHPAGYVYRS